MFRQAPSFPYHDLGIVEDGNTASRAISKDAYVIWKGASYFASTDILQGATLEEDVNLTAVPDGVINGVVSALNNNIIKIVTDTYTSDGSGIITLSNFTDSDYILSVYASAGYFAFPRFGVNNAHALELFAITGGTTFGPAFNKTTSLTILYTTRP